MIPGSANPLLLAQRLLPFEFSAELVTLPSVANWSACAYSPISQTWCITAFNSDASAYSTDGGETWTPVALPEVRNWSQVVADFAGGFLVGVQNNSNYAHGGVPSWTGAVITGSASIYAPLCNNGTNIFAMTTPGNSERAIHTSGGGGAWTLGDAPAGTPGTSNGFSSLAGYNSPTTKTVAGRIAGGSNESAVASSNTGSSWASIAGMSAYLSRPLVGCNGSGNVGTSPRFVAVSGSGASLGNNVMRSDDGGTWDSGTLLGSSSNAWTQPVWCGNAWVICGLTTTQCLTSPDGVVWTSHTLPASVPSSGLGAVFPGSTNGQLPQTIVPRYNTNQAIIIRTSP
jgi:hypothetical protein